MIPRETMAVVDCVEVVGAFERSLFNVVWGPYDIGMVRTEES